MKKFFNTIFTCLFVVCLVKSNVAFADSYYVSKNGNDKNKGSYEKPFKTIQKALDIAKAGDTVNIREGTYNEQLTVRASGTKNSPICIRNYKNDNVIVDGYNKSTKNSNGNIALLSIINKSYVEVKGIEFKNLSTDTKNVVHGIFVSGYGDGVSIKNCKVHHIETRHTSHKANAHGISVYGFESDRPISNITIDGNEVYKCKLGCSESVVLNGNVTNFTVTNNIIHDNDNIGIDFIGHEGTVDSSKKDRARDGVCIGNYVYNITSRHNHVYEGSACADGIYVDGGKNILIERNIVKNCDIGISASSEHEGKDAENIIIRNNLITDCLSYAGITLGGADSDNGLAKNVKIYNNTIYHCSIGIVIQNANSSSNEIANNIIYKSVREPIYGKVRKNKVLNNFTENPSFVNESKGDFRLKENSPAINKGINVDYGDYDLDKNARVSNGTVDMGCYEYSKRSRASSVDSRNIDNLSKDWGNIESISKNFGHLKELKMCKDNEYLYIYILGEELDNYPNVHVYMNTDNDTNTGFSDGGTDYLIENNRLYKYSKKYGSSWDFEHICDVTSYVKNDTYIEYKIKLSSLENLANTLNLKIVLSNKNWDAVCQLPESGFCTYE
ncbi:MAG: right-handed parallel beta-helix repeat-containing protein [Clostridiales bacterium]|nr:right-handed parallel beta-helix repeat-containing protein [Clostridiales bacterium]